MNKVMPSITVLTDDQIQQIHEYSLKILATVGVRVDSSDARAIFAKSAGASVKGDRVYLSPELIEHALEQAPPTVDVFDRTRAFTFQLGNLEENETRFGIGVTNLFYQDPRTDVVEPFERRHTVTAVRLGNFLKNFDIISTPGILHDFPPETADLFATLELVANTTKPVVLLISKSQLFEKVLDLIESLHGDLCQKPFVLPYFNPITPLVLNEETTEMMKITIRRGLPLIFSNYGMSGASSPITSAGTMVVLNAELLAGLVFAQLVKQGTPVILGSLPAGFDMKTMISVYTPKSILLNLACAEMMAFYKVPHSGTSGSGTGWGPDLLASGTFWMNHLTSCMGKVGIAPFVGGNFDSLAFSPAVVVYADHIIQQARDFREGFELDDDSVDLEEVASIGPAGNYLLAGLTFKLCREADYGSGIWPVITLDEWQNQKSPRAEDILRKHTDDIIRNLEAPEDYGELLARGEAFIRNLGKNVSV